MLGPVSLLQNLGRLYESFRQWSRQSHWKSYDVLNAPTGKQRGKFIVVSPPPPSVSPYNVVYTFRVPTENRGWLSEPQPY